MMKQKITRRYDPFGRVIEATSTVVPPHEVKPAVKTYHQDGAFGNGLAYEEFYVDIPTSNYTTIPGTKMTEKKPSTTKYVIGFTKAEMALWDHFAANTPQELLKDVSRDAKAQAQACAEFADAMLKERAERANPD